MTPLPDGTRTRRRWLPALVVVSILGPAAALLGVWLPEIQHYRVTTPEIGRDLVSQLRTIPDDAILARIDGVRFGLARPDSDSRTRADEILAGHSRPSAGDVLPTALEPTAENLEAGSPSAQLQTSSLAAVETLLDAYRETGEPRYFDAALRSVLAWARFERRAWLPVGFLWNDHAIAARVLVLARLWREYRTHADFDPRSGAEILVFVARSTELLSRDSLYTVRTNHGVMQDLALLHAAVAFPLLPDTQEHTRLALERLALHLPFYVAPNGVVLEHSVGYQDFAIRLLRNALGYADLLHSTALPDLRDRYVAAECLQRHLTRPDGSLPLYGDTMSGVRPAWLVAENAAVSCGPEPDERLDQDFGLASLHDFSAPGIRLFMTWANFPGRAHKHDDELAAWLWMDGQDWWGASGYWPYGDADRVAAVSWRGANAPHAVDETGADNGHSGDSRLLYSLHEGPVQLLDVQRLAPTGRAYRRQLLGLGALGVLALDSASGNGAATRFESVWTLMPGAGMRPLKTSDSFELTDSRSGRRLEVSFAGAGRQVQRLSASREPFGGLVARDGVIQESTALVATAPFGNGVASLWQPASGVISAAALEMPAWAGPEKWSLSLPGPAGAYLLARDHMELSLTSPQQVRQVWRLQAGASDRPLRDRAAALYRQAAARYPAFHDYVEYRVRATAGIGALAGGQYLVIWLLGWLGISRSARVTVLALVWAGVGWWLYYSYLT